MEAIDEEAWLLADKRQRIFRAELKRYQGMGFWQRLRWRMSHSLEIFESVASGSRLSSARFIAADPLHRLIIRMAANPAARQPKP